MTVMKNSKTTSLRTLRIKTGVVKRLTKEIASYKKEADQLEQKLQKMKDEGKDEYDIKKMGWVVQESLGMIPHCIRKLNMASNELETLLKNISLEDDDTESAKQMDLAKKEILEAKERIKEESVHNQE